MRIEITPSNLIYMQLEPPKTKGKLNMKNSCLLLFQRIYNLGGKTKMKFFKSHKIFEKQKLF